MPALQSTFRTGEPSLSDILRKIHDGKIQLPDFQRGWVWDDDHIRSLIASVSLSYPIGAVMLLQTGGDGVGFQPRLVEGANPHDNGEPEFLILDGQQRMTSLYLALYSNQPVPTKTEKGQEIERVYYLDIEKCLDQNEDRIDAVLSLPTSRKITTDFGRQILLDISSEEKEFGKKLFPLHVVFDNTRYSMWRRGFQRHYRNSDVELDLFDSFEADVLDRFQRYRIPTIELLNETPKEAVCQVFEKVNTGGVTLTVFELMTATFAVNNFNLREDWTARQQRLQNHEVLEGLDATAFLTAVTLLDRYKRHLQDSSVAVSCKRKDVLNLSFEQFKIYADSLEQGLERAARLLAREKVFDSKSLPYTTQLVPLSAICAVLENRFEQDTIRQKLAQWYWCGVFGELYGGANESRFAFDLPEFIRWIEGGDLPRTIRDATFNPTRLLSMQSRLSAAYKGLMALLLKHSCQDFLSGDTIEITSYFDLAIDIHHIFPKAYCEKENYSRSLWNSSVNKTPLSARSNRVIGGKAPSKYLASIEKDFNIPTSRLDEILSSHQIQPHLIRNDQFVEFIANRAARLLDLIEQAMNKKIAGRESEEVIQAFGKSLLRNSEAG
jgi:hypothetical protein